MQVLASSLSCTSVAYTTKVRVPLKVRMCTTTVCIRLPTYAGCLFSLIVRNGLHRKASVSMILIVSLSLSLSVDAADVVAAVLLFIRVAGVPWTLLDGKGTVHLVRHDIHPCMHTLTKARRQLPSSVAFVGISAATSAAPTTARWR